MEKEAFARLLDRSWPSFRDRLLQSYPGNGSLAVNMKNLGGNSVDLSETKHVPSFRLVSVGG